jgi:phage FluMu protein Com
MMIDCEICGYLHEENDCNGEGPEYLKIDCPECGEIHYPDDCDFK